eukprot:1160118-Pelagomonas_calceolata.AAC.20
MQVLQAPLDRRHTASLFVLSHARTSQHRQSQHAMLELAYLTACRPHPSAYLMHLLCRHARTGCHAPHLHACLGACLCCCQLAKDDLIHALFVDDVIMLLACLGACLCSARDLHWRTHHG